MRVTSLYAVSKADCGAQSAEEAAVPPYPPAWGPKEMAALLGPLLRAAPKLLTSAAMLQFHPGRGNA